MLDFALPLVSVIVPAFNAELHIKTALDCIAGQGLPGLEVIVIDDGSTDRTAEIAAAHPIRARVVTRQNGGPGAARNMGLHLAQGSFLTFLDVDDKWPDGSLSRRLEVFQAQPATQMVMGCVRFEGLDGTELALKPWAAPNLGAGLYRREVFAIVGDFEPSLLLDDVDWFWRARDAGVVTVKLEEITLHYRRHSQSLTAAKTWIELGLAKVISRALSRREPGRKASSLSDLIDLAAPR
jgi:glycosyltransferase involved in cell wall biosynthesis